MGSSTTLQRSNHQAGFISLIKEMVRFSTHHYFPVADTALSTQDKIQKESYLFVVEFFKKVAGPDQGNPMLIFITKIDMTEIDMGLIDLSAPILHGKKYETEEAERIFEQNQTALSYLINPFSSRINDQEFSEHLDKLIETVEYERDPYKRSAVIDDFMKRENVVINEVLLFSQILGLICLSQSLYAFTYQIKQNKNFVKIIEMILANDEDFEAEHVLSLAARYSSVFKGNLAARVFSSETLKVIEDAFSQSG